MHTKVRGLMFLLLTIAMLALPGVSQAVVTLIDGNPLLFDGIKVEPSRVDVFNAPISATFDLGVPSQDVFGALITYYSANDAGVSKPASVDFYFSNTVGVFNDPPVTFDTAAWPQHGSWTITTDAEATAAGSGQYLKITANNRDAWWLMLFEIQPVLTPFTPPPPEWNKDVSGNWSVAANWYPSTVAPSGDAATAKFGARVAGPVAVNVDVPTTVNKIIFDNANAYTISGNTLSLAGTTPTIQAVTGSHVIEAPVALVAAATMDTAAPAGLTLSGVVSGAALTKTGPGTLSLSNTGNGYSGTVLSGGTLSIAGDGSLGALPGAPETNITVTANSSLQVPASVDRTIHANRNIDIASGATLSPRTSFGGTLTIAGVVSGDGALNFSTWYADRADGLYKLTGHNTYTGGTSIAGDGYGTMTVEVTADDNLGTAPSTPTTNITFGGGYQQRLRWGAQFDLNAKRSIWTNGNAEFDIDGRDITLANKISGPGGPCTVSAGTLTLTNPDNDFTGHVYATAGILRGDSAGVWGRNNPNPSVDKFLLLFGGAVQAGASYTMDTFTQIGLDSGRIDTMDGVTLTVPGKLVSWGAGALTKEGAGTLSLTGANIYTGATTITGGTLSIASIADGGLTPTLTTTAGSEIVTASDTTGLVVGQVVLSASIPAGKTIASIVDPTHFTLNDGTSVADGTDVASTIGTANSLGIATNAAGNLVFNGGGLRYTGSAGATDRLFTLNAGGGTIDASGTGVLVWSNTGSPSGTGALTLTGANAGANTLSASITSASSLTKAGAGTWVLTGANTYIGLTTVKAGTLQLVGAGAQNPVLNVGGSDIQGGKMVLKYSGSAPNVLTPLIASYNAGAWNTGQFKSTTADASHGLGWADNGVDQVKVAYTFYGDATLDGSVDASDLAKVLANYNQLSGMVWGQGDFDYNATVDATDLAKVLANYNQGPIVPGITAVGLDAQAIQMLTAAGFTVVPEPSTLVLLAAGLLGLLCYAWRRRPS